MSESINLSVVAPAFNEEESLPSVVEDWVNILSNSPMIDSYEIVICDDGSSDSTPSVLNDLSDQYGQALSFSADGKRVAISAPLECVKITAPFDSESISAVIPVVPE